MSIYLGDFAKEFGKVLRETGVSIYKIASYTGLDEGYLSRLKSGEKQHPSPETIVKIGLALTHYSEKVTIHNVEQLFKATGRSIWTD